ncbi:MAG TPA: AAA family ATPase, partial [Fimbriimonadaceae bacterium]|nr:AAA family ATPase [Fimbriimonadaceae bacterium]
GPYGDHLRRLLVLLTSNDEDTEVVRALLRGQPPCTERAFYRVRSAGLVTGTSVQECRIRCELYAAYLSDHLLPFVEAPNPYVPRSPLPPESPLFLGREETFEFLARHVMEQHVQRHAVLYGERRVGKTSIIRRLHRELPPERFVACMIDLQSLISSGFANFLYSLALEISDSLAAAVPPIVVSPPELQRLQQREQRFEEEFLRAVCRGLGDRRLVLALDEYEHLTTLSNSLDTTPDRLFGYLRHLMQAYTQITFVLTGAHVLTELPDPRWRTYLNLASCHRVRLLGDSEMRSLIVSPVSEAGQIYDETAVSSIASLAGGHPSFLQTICSYLVAHRNRSRRPRISEAEVTHCLEGILSEVDDVLAEVWETRSTSRERILMALIAEGVAAGGSPTLGELSLLAERQFPSANPSEISDVFARLKDREIVTEDRSDGTISFRIGLQYEWLTRYKLGSVKREGLRW